MVHEIEGNKERGLPKAAEPSQALHFIAAEVSVTVLYYFCFSSNTFISVLMLNLKPVWNLKNHFPNWF